MDLFLADPLIAFYRGDIPLMFYKGVSYPLKLFLDLAKAFDSSDKKK